MLSAPNLLKLSTWNINDVEKNTQYESEGIYETSENSKFYE